MELGFINQVFKLNHFSYFTLILETIFFKLQFFKLKLSVGKKKKNKTKPNTTQRRLLLEREPP